jgi:hypothetical protein
VCGHPRPSHKLVCRLGVPVSKLGWAAALCSLISHRFFSGRETDKDNSSNNNKAAYHIYTMAETETSNNVEVFGQKAEGEVRAFVILCSLVLFMLAGQA